MPATFFVGCKVRIQLLLDTYAPTPPVPSSGAPGPIGAESFGPGSKAPGFAAITQDIVPYNCSINLNSYRKADEAQVSLPYSRLPVDPRIVRAATVQIFGGVYSSLDFANANGPVNAPGLLIPDAPGPDVAPQIAFEGAPTNEIFRGFVDDWEVEVNQESDTLSFSARDLTAGLIDAEVPANALRDIPSLLPLDQVIQLLVTGDGIPEINASRRFGVPGYRGLVVVNEVIADGDPTGAAILPLPTLAEIRPPTYLDSKGTAKKGRKNSPGGSQRISYWDLITDLVVSAGFVCFIRPGQIPVQIPGFGLSLPAAELVITNPRTYYAKSSTAGQVYQAPPLVRRFIVGQNVQRARVKRDLKGITVPTIEVRSYDTVTGQQLVARFPPLPKNNVPAVSGIGDREEVKTFILDEIGGPTAILQLQSIAQSIYEQLGRGDIHLEIESKHLSSLLPNLDRGIIADMFVARPGEPCLFQTAPVNIEAGQTNSFLRFQGFGVNVADRAQILISAGVDPDFATGVAAALQNAYLQREFRIQEINWDWNYDSGWGYSVRAINYIDVRDSLQAGLGFPTAPSTEI